MRMSLSRRRKPHPADWWAADYSYTIPEAQCADTVDTSSFVTIKMWDYNEMFNLHGSDLWKVDGDARRAAVYPERHLYGRKLLMR